MNAYGEQRNPKPPLIGEKIWITGDCLGKEEPVLQGYDPGELPCFSGWPQAHMGSTNYT